MRTTQKESIGWDGRNVYEIRCTNARYDVWLPLFPPSKTLTPGILDKHPYIYNAYLCAHLFEKIDSASGGFGRKAARHNTHTHTHMQVWRGRKGDGWYGGGGDLGGAVALKSETVFGVWLQVLMCSRHRPCQLCALFGLVLSTDKPHFTDTIYHSARAPNEFS